MRAEEFVRRADEEVRAQHADVDGGVGRVVDAVHVDEGANLVGTCGDPCYLWARAEQVGGPRDGDQPAALGDDIRELVQVEVGGCGVEAKPAHGRADALGGLDPGAHVGVVIELTHDNLVDGSPVLR